MRPLTLPLGRILRVARLAAPLTNGPLLYRARASGSAECLLWVSSQSLSFAFATALPAPKPSFSNSGYEFLRAGGERSFASIKIPGSRCGATVAASACWREGGSS
jgi:hypothetical protein